MKLNLNLKWRPRDIDWRAVARSFLPTRWYHILLYGMSALVYAFIFYAYASFDGPMFGYDNFWTSNSCFSGDTEITMADGSLKPIAQVRVGDWVLSPDGGANRVIGVERPPLGLRRLYGVNGWTPFFTAEHPLLTAEGWKSVAPAVTAEEMPTLKVARLSEGDRLVRAEARHWVAANDGRWAGFVPPRRTLLLVERIADAPASARLTVYNLILDGDHRYIANGFVVHNKNGKATQNVGADEEDEPTVRRGRKRRRQRRRVSDDDEDYDSTDDKEEDPDRDDREDNQQSEDDRIKAE